MPAVGIVVAQFRFVQQRQSTALGIREAKPSPTKLLSENAILLPEIVDQVFLVTVHPTSEREHEKLQRMGHCQRLLGRGSLFSHSTSAELLHPTGCLALTIRPRLAVGWATGCALYKK